MTDEAVKFRLGYVEDPLPGHDMYRGFIAIPYLRMATNGNWRVASIRFRCPVDHNHKTAGHGKYMTVAGDRPRLYNTRVLIENDDEIAITEGEFDAIASTLAGVPAVGISGADAWEPHFVNPFLGYETVYIFTDGDPAGRGFGKKIGKTLPNGKIIPMDDDEDVNSTIEKFGKDKFLERIGK